MLTSKDSLKIKEIAREGRKLVIEMIMEAGSGHPGPSLSVIDIIATLYSKYLRVDPQNATLITRDRFILSKGHAAPALYAILILNNFVERDAIKNFRKVGGNLQGHPSIKTRGVDCSSGSLGLGLSAACGMALAAKFKNFDSNIYCLIGDGESDEGQIWEAALFATQYKLDNLYVFVDRNMYQYEGKTEEILKLEPLTDKWEAFGWDVWNTDGNEIDDLIATIDDAQKKEGKPKLIIAHTLKGKGVSFMEGNQKFHAKAPTPEEAKAAILELSGKENYG